MTTPNSSPGASTEHAQALANEAFHAGGILDNSQATNHPTVDQHIDQ